MWRSSHQYSSLVLRFQPRQMRTNIREEVDQLKTQQPPSLSPISPFSISLPAPPSLPSPQRVSSSYCRDLPKIIMCITSTISQVISAAWVTYLWRVRTLDSAPKQPSVLISSQVLYWHCFIIRVRYVSLMYKSVLCSVYNTLHESF